jgi:hypothetical protein
MAKFEFRGFAELWSCSFHANASWFGAGCSISAEAISVRALGHEHIHRRVEVLALRWIWLPLPRFIVISQTGGAHRYSVFQTLRWSRLRAALHSCGYAFTEESRYYSWQRVRDDVQRFHLSDGCHRSVQNQPVGVTSKPATLKCGIHSMFGFRIKGFASR